MQKLSVRFEAGGGTGHEASWVVRIRPASKVSGAAGAKLCVFSAERGHSCPRQPRKYSGQRRPNGYPALMGEPDRAEQVPADRNVRAPLNRCVKLCWIENRLRLPKRS